jgi:hypothetical protein
MSRADGDGAEREAERGAGPGERDEAEVRVVDGGGRRLSPASASARSCLVKPVTTRWMELVTGEYRGGERTRTEGGAAPPPVFLGGVARDETVLLALVKTECGG